LADDIVASAVQSQVVLLFGGRQAGKTTLLQLISRRSLEAAKGASEYAPIVVSVYVDLLGLAYDAGPSEFYRLLLHAAVTSSERYFGACSTTEVGDVTFTHERFAIALRELASATGGRVVKFLFLLDESKRVLGNRFPRGFQDNLFSLLYGGTADLGDHLALVFCGAQELYALFEDETSPIASRAAIRLVTNLQQADVASLLASVLASSTVSDVKRLAEIAFIETGGHAGVSSRLAKYTAEMTMLELASYEECCTRYRDNYVQLFRHWNLRLTPEARVIVETLRTTSTLSLHETATALEEKGFDRFVADRVWEELQFVGVARREGSQLGKTNAAYWRYIAHFVSNERNSVIRDEWSLIEETETALRRLVTTKFSAAWPDQVEANMQKILAADWAKLQELRSRSDRYYPYAKDKVHRDIMECLYLGQIGQLIISSHGWPLFQPLFRDKRHVQDLLASISPVRNDRAHFATVPEKELQRCRIACDDLLVIIERELGTVESIS